MSHTHGLVLRRRAVAAAVLGPADYGTAQPAGVLADRAARSGRSATLVTWPRTPASRSTSRWSRRYALGLLVADTTVAIGVGFGFAVIVPAGPIVPVGLEPATAGWALSTMIGLLTWPLVIAVLNGYVSTRVGVARDEIRSVGYAANALLVAGAVICSFVGQAALLKNLILALAVTAGISLLVRFVLRRLLARSRAAGQSLRTLVLAGSLNSVRGLAGRLAAEPKAGVRVLGVCVPDDQIATAQREGLDVLGPLSTVADVARRLGCDAITVASDECTGDGYLRDLSWSLHRDGVELLVDPGLAEVSSSRMRVRPQAGLSLLQIEPTRIAGWQRVAKRAVDVVLALVALVLGSPVLLTVAAVIKLHDRGPVIFRQTRIGRDGIAFTMLKFRTMVPEAERLKQELLERNESASHLFKLRHDPRITRVGGFLRRYSLDELPQLVNVLTGSMSLVGPRPHLADEVARMPGSAHRRACVTPGMTGLWQVSGRSELTGTQSVRLDLRYVENWSLPVDLVIMCRTVAAVLAHRGAQ